MYKSFLKSSVSLLVLCGAMMGVVPLHAGQFDKEEKLEKIKVIARKKLETEGDVESLVGLPPSVWQLVFLHGDGKVRSDAKLVCRKWYNVAWDLTENLGNALRRGQSVDLRLFVPEVTLFPEIFSRLGASLQRSLEEGNQNEDVNSICTLIASSPIYRRPFCSLVESVSPRDVMSFELFERVCNQSPVMKASLVERVTGGTNDISNFIRALSNDESWDWDLLTGSSAGFKRLLEQFPTKMLNLRVLAGADDPQIFYGSAAQLLRGISAKAYELCMSSSNGALAVNPTFLSDVLSGNPCPSMFLHDNENFISFELVALTQALQSRLLQPKEIDNMLVYLDYIYKSVLVNKSKAKDLLISKSGVFTWVIIEQLHQMTEGQKAKALPLIEGILCAPLINNGNGQLPGRLNYSCLFRYAEALQDLKETDRAVTILERINAGIGESTMRVVTSYFQAKYLLNSMDKTNLRKARRCIESSLSIAAQIESNKDKSPMSIGTLQEVLFVIDLCEGKFASASEYINNDPQDISLFLLPGISSQADNPNLPAHVLEKVRALLKTAICTKNEQIKTGYPARSFVREYTKYKEAIDKLMEGDQEIQSMLKSWMTL